MKYEDGIIAEVRQSRERLLEKFGGDGRKLNEYLRSQQSVNEAAGVHYETDAERQVRFAWNRQQKELENRRVSGL